MAGKAVLICGPSGSGKSDLALRCLAQPVSALVPAPVQLVSDDQVRLALVAGLLKVTAPKTIAGKLEVRGVGIIELPYVAEAELVLVADLVGSGEVERLPEPQARRVLGHEVPLVKIAPFLAAAPLRLLLALAAAAELVPDHRIKNLL